MLGLCLAVCIEINKEMGSNIVYALVGLMAGGMLSFFLWDRLLRSRLRSQREAERKRLDAYRKEKEVEAREHFNELKEAHREECAAREQKVKQRESEVQKRESDARSLQGSVQRKQKELDALRKQLDTQMQQCEIRAVQNEELNCELQAQRKQQQEALQTVACMTVEEAKAQLLQTVEVDARREAYELKTQILDEARLKADSDAQVLVLQSVQRLATETIIDNTVTTFHIDNEEVKGKIIGREGRNIRALEQLIGVDIMVDDSPESIGISSFDPVRREVARLSLHQLVQDGRIHPSRIEEVVTKVKKQLEEEMLETGRQTVIDLGLQPMSVELTKMVGRMKYRSSYGQNLLQHSREVANLCSIMAQEFKVNAKLAKRAGLLHDLGKVLEDSDVPHALSGMKMAERNKEHPDVCNAIGAHHNEVEFTSMLGPIVQVCDAISGARPGARRNVLDAYVKRLGDLENLALAFPGVEKTYAIQAGRELRVFVESEKVSDAAAAELSAEIAQKIEKEMTYPGQVKVIVIREMRSVAVAK